MIAAIMKEMLDSKKLLYILPEVAYLAEGLPAKKPHSFSIHSFTQINGNFLNEDTFIAENIQKLFGKLEAGESYHIILPDFLFTNTIVSIKEKNDSAIKEHLQDTTFPQMGISKDSHLIDSAVLNEIRGTSRVQLSAIERELLAPIRVATQDHAVSIVGISPLSWAIKSLISLEPSISVLQMGTHLYACEHYIGIDQASYAPIDDIVSIAETIKTLKGSEPSIQTVYLLSNPLVEEKLKEALNKTLPIQQMAGSADDEDRMPASVKQVIEFSLKTLSIPDYPVPVFSVTKPTAEEVASFGAVATAKVMDESEDDTETVEAELPKPATPIHVSEQISQKMNDIEPDETPMKIADTTSVLAPAATAASPISEIKKLDFATDMTKPAETEEKASPEATDSDKPEEKTETSEVSKPIKPALITPSIDTKSTVTTTTTTPKPKEDIDLSQFVGAQSKQESPAFTSASPNVAAPLPTIKNKSGVQNMLKMIFITLAVFCLTVAVGVGVGLAILKYSGSESGDETPVVAVESTTTPTPAPTTTPEPTPVASASATTAPTNLKILVVNATTKAGYAGTFKTKIEQSKLGKVTATNAKGKYDSGFVVYMKKQDDAAIAKLEEVTGLKTTFDEAAKDEDPQGTYDLILVLAE